LEYAVEAQAWVIRTRFPLSQWYSQKGGTWDLGIHIKGLSILNKGTGILDSKSRMLSIIPWNPSKENENSYLLAVSS
jgi:hypothetical protein